MAAVCSCLPLARTFGPLPTGGGSSLVVRQGRHGGREQCRSSVFLRRHQPLIVAASPKDGGESDDTWRTKTLTELEADFLGEKRPKVTKKPVSEKLAAAAPAKPGKPGEFRSVLDEMDEMIFGKPKKESEATGISALLNKTSKWLVDNTDVSPDDTVVLTVVSIILFVWVFLLGVATGVLHVPFVERLLGM